MSATELNFGQEKDDKLKYIPAYYLKQVTNDF